MQGPLHTSTPSITISGRLVRLRTLKESDASVLHDNLRDEHVTKFLRAIPYPYRLKDADDFIKTSHLLLRKGIELDFGIEYQIMTTPVLVGLIALARAKKGGIEEGEIGYWVGKMYWNKGIATEAVALAVEYGFSVVGLNSIYAYVMKENTASIHVLEKCGFSFERELPKNTRKNGRWIDEIKYVLIKGSTK